MFSVLILTLDEEADLPGCLASLSWCDDVHVIDSGSHDQTVEIALRSGAHVLTNPFKSFAQQRNWAIDHCPVKHDWLLFLDADERSTPAFVDALTKAITDPSLSTAGFYCCWKTILDGRWLRRSDNFPKWQFRLVRRGYARFADSGHGQKEGEISGSLGYIPEPYLHYAFSRGWSHWVIKHKVYAKKDAMALLGQPLSLKFLFSRHGSRRNSAIKRFVRLIPGWPLLRFSYSYFLRLGFLEGPQGLEYCRRMMWYEYQIQRELSSSNAIR
jgi:glycosyltransferase involved in cell wall biosynthesis